MLYNISIAYSKFYTIKFIPNIGECKTIHIISNHLGFMKTYSITNRTRINDRYYMFITDTNDTIHVEYKFTKLYITISNEYAIINKNKQYIFDIVNNEPEYSDTMQIF